MKATYQGHEYLVRTINWWPKRMLADALAAAFDGPIIDPLGPPRFACHPGSGWLIPGTQEAAIFGATQLSWVDLPDGADA